MKNWKDKLARNWYALAAVAALLFAPALPALPQTIARFVGVAFLAAWTANMIAHIYTSIAWRDWTGNDEFEKVGKSLVLAAIVGGCLYLAGEMFQREHESAQIGQLNEEFQSQDSTRAAK